MTGPNNLQGTAELKAALAIPCPKGWESVGGDDHPILDISDDLLRAHGLDALIDNNDCPSCAAGDDSCYCWEYDV